jgi:hypothetical protein
MLSGHGASADVIYLTEAGRLALQKNGLVEPHLRSDGKGWVLQGQIIVLRDDADRPILPNSRRYFMFRPLKGPFTATGPDGTPNPAAHEVRLDLNWTSQKNLEIDTLDDVRGLISNRDLRYGSGADALGALLADIDPGAVLYPGRPSPAVAYDKIVAREGWLSNFLIHGRTSATARQQEIDRERALPPEDPLGFNPLDPRLFFEDGGVTLMLLERSMARCDRWGEPEPGLRASCFAVAHFICDTLYVEPAAAPVGARSQAGDIRAFVANARLGLRLSIHLVSPIVLSQPRKAGAPAGWPLASGLDDPQLVTTADMAKVALEILDTCRAPRSVDRDGMLDDLMACAADRADFRPLGKRQPLPEYDQVCDQMGQKAFEIILHMASAPTDGSADEGGYFRVRLRTTLGSGGDPAVVRVAREALVRAGMADDSEIAPTLDYLLSVADRHGVDPQLLEDAVYVLKKLPDSIADSTRRGRFQTEVARRLQGYQDAVKSGDATAEVKRIVELYGGSP